MVRHLCIRLDAEYLAYQVMRQTLQEIRQEALEQPWAFSGEEAGELAATGLEIEASLVGEEEGGGDGT